MLTETQHAGYAHCVRWNNPSSPQDRDPYQLYALAGDAEVHRMYLVEELFGLDDNTQPRRRKQAGLRVRHGRALDTVLQHIVLWCS